MNKRKKRMGRPPFVPTQEERELVKRLVGLGLSVKEIAARMRTGIAYETLNEVFPKGNGSRRVRQQRKSC